MINRVFKQRLDLLLKTFPIVSILGPRQCGKTSFIRSVLSKWTYLDLERPSDAEPLSQDPEGILAELKSHFILDEAQKLPSLFPVLRHFVDQNRKKNGQLVLLGSASPHLITQISESLAGRVGFLDMSPFLWSEVRRKKNLDELWFRGGYPDAFLETSDKKRNFWFDAYTRTFIERDLTSLQIEVSAPQMRRLWAMLSHVNGGLWNASQVGGSLGVNHNTINRYVDILEQTFLIRKLQPYHTNIGKRLTKSPKIYFQDTGLLHYFLGIKDKRTLRVHPGRGFSWEAFVVNQSIGTLGLSLPNPEFYFWRTAAGAEVDLVVKNGTCLLPFEIKLHPAPKLKEIRGLISFMADMKISRGFVLYPGKKNYHLGRGIYAISAQNFLEDPKRTIGKISKVLVK